ncbi:GNAT family N-acetyltransferase [Micromonospora sonneratiae]|uniref:GNAT family N-acetyltransferase n=1 Tax=Micromonospora sonneratiae TaxID=1184706 RepID=A0ABW3YJC4_9ACTN
MGIVVLTDDRVPAVVELCRAALDLPEDAAEAEQIVTRLRQRPGDRRTDGFIALVDDAVVGVVLSSLSSRKPDRGHIDLLAVLPSARRKGIGRALLVRAEADLADRGATEVWIAGNPPYYAWPGIDVRYTPAVCLAMKLGYEQDRTAWNMTADLSYDGSPALRSTAPAEERLAAAGIAVRRATSDDLPALASLITEHFGGAWYDEVSHSVDRTDSGCHIAVRGDELLGFAAYGSSRPTWFGPMGTAPAAEGLGIGGVLLRRCLRDQRASGHEQAQIGWVGPVPFYSGSAGARIERVFFLYRRQL